MFLYICILNVFVHSAYVPTRYKVLKCPKSFISLLLSSKTTVREAKARMSEGGCSAKILTATGNKRYGILILCVL